MKNRINFEKSQELQSKYGAGFYVVENDKAGNQYTLLLNEEGGWEREGSDISDDDDNSDQDEPLFEDEDKQKKYNENKANVFEEIYKTWRKSSKHNFLNIQGLPAKAKLRDMKSDWAKLDLDFVSKAMGMEPTDLVKDMARNPRLRDNINSLMNKPISTLRRAFSPKGDTFTREMLEDTGLRDTVDLIAAVITKFGE